MHFFVGNFVFLLTLYIVCMYIGMLPIDYAQRTIERANFINLVGFSSGILLSGIMMSKVGHRSPFYCAFGVSVIILVFVYWQLLGKEEELLTQMREFRDRCIKSGRQASRFSESEHERMGSGGIFNYTASSYMDTESRFPFGWAMMTTRSSVAGVIEVDDCDDLKPGHRGIVSSSDFDDDDDWDNFAMFMWSLCGFSCVVSISFAMIIWHGPFLWDRFEFDFYLSAFQVCAICDLFLCVC